MACSYLGIVINGDINNRVKETLMRSDVAGDSIQKQVLISYSLNNETSEFIKFANNTLINKGITVSTIEDFGKLNKNSIAKVLNSFYATKFPNLYDFATKRTRGNLGQFTSAAVKVDAMNYISNLIIDSFDEKNYSRIEVNSREILKETINTVHKEFNNRLNNLLNIINEIKNTNAQNSIEWKLYKSNENLINEYYKNIEEIRKLNSSRDIENVKKRNFLIINLQGLAYKIFKELGSVSDFNFSCLYNELLSNGNQFINESLNHNPQAARISYKFRKVLMDEINPIDLTEETNGYDESYDTDETERNVDGNTASYHKSSVPKRADDLLSGKFKIDLLRLYKLQSPYKEPTVVKDLKTNTEILRDINTYDTDNSLGVKTKIDSEKIYNLLLKYTSKFEYVASPEKLIQRLEWLSQNNKELYCIGSIVNKMKTNKEYSNFVWKQFKHPHIKKIIINIAANGIKPILSNANLDSIASQYLNIAYNLKYNYIQFTSEDIIEIDNAYNTLQRLKVNPDLDINGSKLLEIQKLIVNKLKYISLDFNDNVINSYINNVSSINKIDKYIELVNQIKTIIDGGLKEIKRRNEDLSTYKKEHKQSTVIEGTDVFAVLTKTQVSDNVVIDTPFDNNSYMNLIDNTGLRDIKSSIFNLITNLDDFTNNSIQQESINAKGNLSSNIIVSSLISDTFDLIHSTDEIAKQAIIDKFTTTPQFLDNPILFGIHDKNGKELFPALLINNNGTYTINEKVQKTLDYYLFDGIKNNNTGEGADYDSLNSTDFILTQLISYIEGIRDITSDSNERTMLHFDETPADAPKRFMFKLNKINTENMFDNKSIEYILNEFLNKSGISEKISKPVDEISNSDIKRNINNIIKHKKNEYTEFDEFFDILSAEQPYIQFNDVIEYKSAYPVVSIFYKTENGYICAELNTEKDLANQRYIKQQNVDWIRNIYIVEDNNATNKFPDYILENIKNRAILQSISNNENIFKINKESATFNGFRNILKNELVNFVWQLNTVFEQVPQEGGISFIEKDNTDGLLLELLRKEGKIANDKGINRKLIGNIFHFTTLFQINDFNTEDKLIQTIKKLSNNTISLYGGINEDCMMFCDSNNHLRINPNCSLFDITKDNNNQYIIKLKDNDIIDSAIEQVTEQWLNEYFKFAAKDIINKYNDIINTYNQYVSVDKRLTIQNAVDFYVNNTLFNYAYDELLSQSDKFYSNAKTKTKRDKQVQMGGEAYSTDRFNNPLKGQGNVIDTIKFNGEQIQIKDTFVGITAYNVNKPSDNVTLGNIQLKLLESLNYRVKNEEITKEMSDYLFKFIMKGYSDKTKVNDAQSYITEEEFIRRRYLDGTLNEYLPVLKSIKDGKVLSQSELEFLGHKIQVQKNIYVDTQKDEESGLIYARQIKNSEFVLIPELIKGTPLYDIWETMTELGIDQLNTDETSKANTRDIVKCWNDKGEFIGKKAFTNNINSSKNAKELYSYQHLYKQQDIVDHIVDEENKVGLQISKKIFDNIDANNESVKKYIENYTANFKMSYNEFISTMGWKEVDGKLVNYDGKEILDYSSLYEVLKQEVARLGLNSNINDYFTLDEVTKLPIMPNYLARDNSKLESIVNSLITHRIARQTIAGWHGVQVSGLCIGRKLRYKPTVYRNNQNPNIDIHKEQYDKLSDEEKQNYTETIAEYMEIVIPRWNNVIDNTNDEETLKKLEEQGLDKMVLYRMPTEGKQSMVIAKVVGFCDNRQGSVCFVPDEWITQTGSDFDIDTIYAITYNLRKINDKYIKVSKNDNETNNDKYARYILDLLNKSDLNVNDRDRINDIINDIKNTRKLYKKQVNDLFIEKKAQYETILAEQKLKDKTFEDLNKLPDDEYKTQLFKKLESLKDNYKGIALVKQEKYWLNKLYQNNIDIYNEEQKDILENAIDYCDIVISQITKLSDLKEQSDIIDNFDQASKDKLFNLCEDIAKSLGFVSYKDFSNFNDVEKESKEVRDNNILDSYIEILSNKESTEENLSRSNFDEIKRCINTYGQIIGIEGKPVSDIDTSYQLIAMDNGTVARRLKAESVQNDTFVSVCNKVQPTIKLNIKVTYHKLTNVINENGSAVEYDINYIENAYERTTRINDESITVTHDKFGWNKNKSGIITNRNAVGQLITTYGAQTTAHILDAIKTGMLHNENEFTFGAFKLLLGLGIDYDTAISFLMQPAIQTICNEYFKSNSVYSEHVNKLQIINNALAKYTEEQIKFIDKNERQDIQLDTNKLVDRLKNYDKENKEFDIKIIKDFYKLLDAYDRIHNIMLCTNPDKFGAKQTNKESRDVISNIYKLGYDETTKDTILKDDNNTPILQLIYPNIFGENGISIKDSKYPILASALKYATIFSTILNEDIFTLEGKGFVTPFSEFRTIKEYKKEIDEEKEIELKTRLSGINDEELRQNIIDEINQEYAIKLNNIVYSHYGLLDKIQSTIGKKFSKKEYQQYKKYITSYLAYNNKTLLTPLIVDKNGYYIANQEMINENNELNTDYWDREVTRVFGIDTIENGDLKVENITNPTDEEISKFAKLTPAQKIIWLKINLADKSFTKYLDVRQLTRRYKDSIYSIDRISFDEHKNNIEILLDEFDKTSINKHPFNRLLAADLVKYAFLVEGFQFKFGGITKLINNTILLNGNNKGGLCIEDNAGFHSLIDSFNNNIENLKTFGNDTKYVHDFVKSFVRSNSDNIKTISLYRRNKDNKTLKSILDKYSTIGESYYIPFEDTIAIRDLVPEINYAKEYIRFNQTINKEKVDQLYKIDYLNNGIYIYPIGKLEYNEYGEYSKNPYNNPKYSLEFYEIISNYIKRNEINEIKNIDKSKYEIEPFKKRLSKDIAIDYIEVNKDNNTQIKATYSAITEQLADHIKNNRGTEIIIADPHFTLRNIVKNNLIEQKLIINGKNYRFNIINYSSSKLRSIVESRRKGIINDKQYITNSQQSALDYLVKHEGFVKYDLYSFVIEEEQTKSQESKQLIIDFDSQRDLSSSTLLIGTSKETENNIKTIDEAAGIFALDLLRQASRDTSVEFNAAKTFRTNVNMGYINPYNTKSIIRNKKSIFESTAKYYKEESAKIISLLKNYELNGTTYALDNPELYEQLIIESERNPQSFDDLLELILYAKHFGDNIIAYTELDLTDEDVEFKAQLQSIIESIKSVKNSKILLGSDNKDGAIGNLLNIYFAKKYSTNPLIRNQIIDIRNTFGDINWFDLKISSINEISNKEVQVVMKYINQLLNKSSEIDAPAIVADFKSKFDKLYKEVGKAGLDKLIDKEGKWIQPYTADYLIEKENIRRKLSEVRNTYGINSKEYYRAKLDKMKWYIDNVEQELDVQFYINDYNNLKEVLENAEDLFVEYRKIQAQINEIRDNITLDKSTKTTLLDNFKNKKSNLLSKYDESGTIKSKEETDKIDALINYIKNTNNNYKEYFDINEGSAWKELLKENTRIIKKYDENNPLATLEQKLYNKEYREAYEWIKENAIYDISDELRDKIKKAYSDITDINNPELTSHIGIGAFKSLFIKDNNLVDEYGNIDPRKLTIEQTLEYKKQYELLTQGNENLFSEQILLKDVNGRNNPLHPDFAVYTSQFYRDISGEELNSNSLKKYEDIINKINQLIIKSGAVNNNIKDGNTENNYNKIDVIALMNNLNVNELIELSNLYIELKELKKLHHRSGNPDNVKKFHELAIIDVNNVAFEDDFNTAKYSLSSKKFELFKEIFCERNYKTGKLIVDENGEFYPNEEIYGIIVPRNKEKYIDKRKTNARQFLARNIRKEVIPYYYEKRNEMRKKTKEEYGAWFNANHIYNIFEHKYEPINLWTESKLREDSEFINELQYRPTYENIYRTAKKDKLNENYHKGTDNYNISTGNYNDSTYARNIENNPHLKAMYNLLIDTSRRYASLNYATQKFANVYAPREALINNYNITDIIKGVTNFFGITNPNRVKDEWEEIVDYNHDKDIKFSMFELLKQKNSKELIKPHKQKPTESDAEYQEYLNKVNEENDKIKKQNLEIDNAILNRDWRTVFINLIYKGENMLARQRAKNPLYLLMTDIAENEAIKLDRLKHNPILNKQNSNNEDIRNYYGITQHNLLDLLQTIGHRIIYDEYKKPSYMNNVAKALQGFTSSKYMMFNILGGMANVSTGLVNIVGEEFAGDYFSTRAFNKALKLYRQNSLTFLKDLYSDEASSLVSAIVKKLNVVDYDEINGERTKKGLNEVSAKLNDIAYSPQSMGEHFMQNTAALALIEDSRIYKDNNGNYVIGTFRNYTWQVECNVFRQLIRKYSEQYKLNGSNLEEIYNTYINKITNDKTEQNKYDSFREDINLGFIKLLRKSFKDTSKFEKEFIDARNKAFDIAKKEFDGLENLYDQFEFVKNEKGTGVARIKLDSNLNCRNDNEFNYNEDGTINSRLGDEKLASFITKCRSINDKIHGVYNKLGRASIENEWWGTLVMQYHKHIYPGIMKRYRGILGRSYYNEQRESIEKGSYTALWDLLTFEFNDFKFKHRKEFDNNGNIVDTEVTALQSIQDVCKMIITTITNMYANYKLMPDWERASIRRSLGDLFGVLGTALFVLAIYGLTDDDELKESNFAASVMYVSCRCFSEAKMFYPIGMITEFETLYSQPVAGFSSPNDILKILGITANALFDEDFDINYTTGQYKGRNKLEVLVTRNTPIYRIYNNFVNMTKRNSYYNGLYNTGQSQKFIKEIADTISPE